MTQMFMMCKTLWYCSVLFVQTLLHLLIIMINQTVQRKAKYVKNAVKYVIQNSILE